MAVTDKIQIQPIRCQELGKNSEMMEQVVPEAAVRLPFPTELLFLQGLHFLPMEVMVEIMHFHLGLLRQAKVTVQVVVERVVISLLLQERQPNLLPGVLTELLIRHKSICFLPTALQWELPECQD